MNSGNLIMEAIVPPAVDEEIRGLIRQAVREDVGSGDKTVELAIPRELMGEGRIVARRAGVMAGMFLLEEILEAYGAGLKGEVEIFDGERVTAGTLVGRVKGPVRGILTAERVVLNFLGHMSGVATMTRRYVDAVAQVRGGAAEKRPVICDTRKTTPGWRVLDKYAVRCGGGVNHRMGLYDGVMLKDNHLAALRERLGKELTLAELTRRVRGELEKGITLWLEVDTLEQLREELEGGGGADVVLLDNFTPEEMIRAVEMRDELRSKKQGASSKKEVARSGGVLLEASGGITLENIGAVAQTGVDRISIGALTHSAPVLDLSMEMG
jgi:nicotinate-nucleotide pyrophosphorylase (carboxylating)